MSSSFNLNSLGDALPSPPPRGRDKKEDDVLPEICSLFVRLWAKEHPEECSPPPSEPYFLSDWMRRRLSSASPAAPVAAAAVDTSKFQAQCRDKNRALVLMRLFLACSDDKKGRACLPKMIDEDPSILSARSAARSKLVPIGWTPLHTVAHAGASDSCRILLEKGADPFARDLTGRLPLHVVAAAEKKKSGHVSVCEQLLAAMRATGSTTAVGADAPTDLAGLTPSAWLLASSSTNPKHLGYVERLKSRMHANGDSCISPLRQRRRRGSRPKRRLGLSVGHSDRPGWRLRMEDAVCVLPSFDETVGLSLFAIFDGHGGDAAAKFCAARLGSTLRQVEPYGLGKFAEALRQTTLVLDDDLRTRENADDSGAVGVVVVVSPENIFVANVGDARVVLAREGSAPLALTKDHKARTHAAERARVERAGASLTETGRVAVPGVTGSLAVTRAFGDFTYKTKACPAVVAEADVTTIKRDRETDRFLVLACDGVWDVLANDDVVKLVGGAIDGGEDDCDRLAEIVISRAFEMGSTDNISAVVVMFGGGSEEEEEDEAAKVSCGGGGGARKALFL